MVDELSEFRIYAAEQYALHIRSLKRKVDALEADVQEQRDSLTGLKAVIYSDMPRSPNAYGDAIPDGIAKLQELIVECVAQIAEWADEQITFRRAIEHMMGAHYTIMLDYYVKGMTWSAVADDIGYTERRVMDLRRDALLELYGTMPEEWRRNIPNAEV